MRIIRSSAQFGQRECNGRSFSVLDCIILSVLQNPDNSPANLGESKHLPEARDFCCIKGLFMKLLQPKPAKLQEQIAESHATQSRILQDHLSIERIVSTRLLLTKRTEEATQPACLPVKLATPKNLQNWAMVGRCFGSNRIKLQPNQIRVGRGKISLFSETSLGGQSVTSASVLPSRPLHIKIWEGWLVAYASNPQHGLYCKCSFKSYRFDSYSTRTC